MKRPYSEAVDKAIALLPVNSTFHSGGHELHVLFLLPESIWRPLKVAWWTGKEVCIIGGDTNGNYFLRSADGSVRYWNHSAGRAEVLAASVREFLGSLRPPGVGEHSGMTNTMTRPWPEIRRHYAEAPPLVWTEGMLALIDYISSSHLASGLFAWTSHFDLCIAQAPVTYPYKGPYLSVSPTQDGRLEFRYIDTGKRDKQWCRVVDPISAVQRFDQTIKQLCWSTGPHHEA